MNQGKGSEFGGTLDAIISTAADAIVIADQSGDIVTWNAAAGAMSDTRIPRSSASP